MQPMTKTGSSPIKPRIRKNNGIAVLVILLASIATLVGWLTLLFM